MHGETRHELITEERAYYLRIIAEIVFSSIVVLYIAGDFQKTLFFMIAIPCSIAVLTFLLEGIIVPILWSIPFACGYTLIMILNFDWKKVRARPLHAIKEVIKRFLTGMIDQMTSIGTITECQYGDWYYEPLFKIYRR